jgi:hypothetical protein
MAPKQATLHVQTLEDTMLQLECCEDTRAMYAFEMAMHGSLYPLNEEILRPIRQTEDMFEEDIRSSPVLTGLQDIPFTSIPTHTQLQNILKRDIGGKNFFRFAPSLGSPELDAVATLNLLTSLLDPLYNARGAVMHMTSPTLDRLQKTNKHSWQNEGRLGESALQVTIAPASEVFDLEYYDYFRISTLLLGAQVRIAYPPLDSNLEHLRTHYSQLQGGRIFGAMKPDLQHGIAIVQRAGETLTLPPFWPCITFCTQTCVAAGHCLATATKYFQRLVNTELYLAMVRLWPDKKKEKLELARYIESLAAHLNRVLNGSFPGNKVDGVIVQLCKLWDVDFKPKVSALCSMIDEHAERDRIRGVFNAAWVTLADEKRRKRPECRLCYKRISDMAGNEGAGQRLAGHVIAEHGV